MMAEMFLYLNLSKCPETKKKLPFNSQWTQRDENSIQRAKRRCGIIYKGLPCLIYFEKVDDGEYRAICGKSR